MTNENHALAEQFEAHRDHLRAVAYRMLGSVSEAEDAVQETWIRLSRSDADSIENLGGWLTTVAGRVCLDMLRTRKSRREEFLGTSPVELAGGHIEGADPEREALLADSVGLALLVVLDTLTPAERLAFVLHDVFGVPFDEIAGIVDRSPEAARQLASRARRRVRGTETTLEVDHTRQREVIDAFLAAARRGDFAALLQLLDPDVVLKTDEAPVFAHFPGVLSDAEAIARSAIAGGARAARPALINGNVGVIIAPAGKLLMVLQFTVEQGRVIEVNAVGQPERLARLELSVLDD